MEKKMPISEEFLKNLDYILKKYGGDPIVWHTIKSLEDKVKLYQGESIINAVFDKMNHYKEYHNFMGSNEAQELRYDISEMLGNMIETEYKQIGVDANNAEHESLVALDKVKHLRDLKEIQEGESFDKAYESLSHITGASARYSMASKLSRSEQGNVDIIEKIREAQVDYRGKWKLAIDFKTYFWRYRDRLVFAKNTVINMASSK